MTCVRFVAAGHLFVMAACLSSNASSSELTAADSEMEGTPIGRTSITPTLESVEQEYIKLLGGGQPVNAGQPEWLDSLEFLERNLPISPETTNEKGSVLAQRASERIALKFRLLGEQPSNSEERLALQDLDALIQAYVDGLVFKSMCGIADESEDVELYDGILWPTKEFVGSYQPATFLLRFRDDFSGLPARFKRGNVEGVARCTGTLLTDRLAITAGHCVVPLQGAGGHRTPYKQEGAKRDYLPAPELVSLMEAQFDYQIDRTSLRTKDGKKFPITRLLEWRYDQAMDYALLEIGLDAKGNGPTADGRIPIETAKADPKQGDLLAVIQHPQGKPKRIAAGRALDIMPPRIFYDDIDTFNRSSGAGILNVEGRLVGVHTNGGCDRDYNRGFLLSAISEVSDVLELGSSMASDLPIESLRGY